MPAVVLAMAQAPERAIQVALLYLAVQLVEGYVITRLIQRRALDMPAGLVLLAQAVAGVLGVIFATPLAAIAVVAIRRLYVEPMEARARRRRRDTATHMGRAEC